MNLAFQDRREASGWSAIFALIAVVCIGQAIEVGFGQFHPVAIILIGVALPALVYGVVCSRLRDPGPWAIRLVQVVGFSAVALQLYQLATAQPAQALMGRPVNDFLALLFVFAGFTVPFCLEMPSYKRLYTVCWFVSFLVVAVWILRATYPPPIDVFSWTHASLDALSEGKNPYEAWMPNMYGKRVVFPDGTNEYGRPMTPDAAWVKAGYPYPPFALMLSIPGYLVGDMRWGNLALVVGGVIMVLRSGGRFSVLAAALVLTTPRIFFVLENAWTDAFCFGLIAITAGLAARSSRWTPWVFGLTLVCKHYMLFLAPLVFLLLPKPWTRKDAAIFIGKTLVAGCAVTVPWILLNPQALLHSIYSPAVAPRFDALTFLFLIFPDGKGPFVDLLPFLLLIPIYTLIFLFSARGAAAFALSSALILSGFFSFARIAMCNQHFLALGCAAIALGTIRFGDEPTPPATDDKATAPNPSDSVAR